MQTTLEQQIVTCYFEFGLLLLNATGLDILFAPNRIWTSCPFLKISNYELFSQTYKNQLLINLF